MANGEVDRLIKIIERPTEYGIFPDSFCYNMILDHLIESSNFHDAARLAFTYILQEDFGNQITNRLAAYSVVKSVYSEAAPVETSESTSESAESAVGDFDEDETQYIRIPVIRNPHFDDHFDLKDPSLKNGKSLYLLGRQFTGDLSFTMKTLGLVLWKKYKQCQELLSSSPQNSLTTDIVNKISSILEGESNEELKKEIEALLLQVKGVKTIKDASLEEMMTNELKNIASLEAKDMDEMKKSFENWIIERDIAVRLQVDDLIRDKRIKEIKEKRKTIKDRERLLYFFENMDKHELELQEAEHKIEEVRRQSQVEEEYVPPTIKG